MKIIDAILIVLILGVGVGYYFQKNRPGSCYKGQIQLTEEVKALIDGEFTKAETRPQEVAGLTDLITKTTAVEKQLAELQALRLQNRATIKEKYDAIRMSSNRKKTQEKQLKVFIEESSRKFIQACSSKKPVKL